VSAERGCCGLGVRVAGERLIVIGMWSELVEAREASQLFTIVRRRGLAKARSMTDGQALPTRGNLVYSPGGLRRAKPASAAFSKYGVEETISQGENELRGSERGLCMLRSPTIRRGIPTSGNRVSGGTEWTLWSRVFVE